MQLKKRTWMPCLLNMFVLTTVIVATFLLAGCDESEVRTDINCLRKVFLPPEGETYDIIGQCDGIGNFVVSYTTELLRGGEVLDEHGLEILKQHDVKTVISMVPSEILEKRTKKYGMSYHEFQFHQDSLTFFLLNDFVKIVQENPGAFFIQCHDGTQRAGILCAYYRMKMEGWMFEKAALEFFLLGGKITESKKMLQVLQGAEKLEKGYESAQRINY